MKINNLQKNLSILLLVFISIFFGTLLSDKINLPYHNITGATGPLTELKYNPNTDVARYIFYISLPLIVFYLSNIFLKKEETINGRLFDIFCSFI